MVALYRTYDIGYLKYVVIARKGSTGAACTILTAFASTTMRLQTAMLLCCLPKRKKHVLPRIRRKVSFLHPFFLYPNGIGKGVYGKSKKIDSLYRYS